MFGRLASGRIEGVDSAWALLIQPMEKAVPDAPIRGAIGGSPRFTTNLF